MGEPHCLEVAVHLPYRDLWNVHGLCCASNVFPCFRFENSKHLSFDPKISLKIEYVDLNKGGN